MYSVLVTSTLLPIAIVGNGGAAAEAVLALRANGWTGDIHLFTDNAHAPYNPMLGTYVVSGKLPLEKAFPFGSGSAFYDANRVTAHLEEPVTRIDTEARELTTARGTYRYERCLVASGARPAVPPVAGLREALAHPGAERRVFALQTVDDALALRRAIDGLRAGVRGAAAGGALRAAVLGASFAGVKIAEVLHGLGFQVTLIEREASVLPLAAHPEAARILEAHLKGEGFRLRLGAALAGVGLPEDFSVPGAAIRLDFGALPGAADPGDPGTACEDGAEREETDLLVVCAGNRPALDFLAPGQVDVGRGILVDDQMRSSAPGLYAAGDVAQGKNLLSGRHEIIGLWSSARYQGRAAGRSIAGQPSGYPGGIPHNITHVGRMLFASMGCVDDYDTVTTTDDGGSRQVRLWRDGRLVGLNILDDCLSAGVMKQAFSRMATGATGDLEATWTSFRS